MIKLHGRSSVPLRSKLLVLIVLWTSCFPLPSPIAAQDQNLAAPDQDEQAKILGRVKDYAEQYVSSLPDFICDQVIEQSEAGKNGKHWRRGDTLVSKLVYSEEREHRTLETINGKAVGAGTRRLHAPLVTEGEFGILLSNIVSSSSEAKFQWIGWEAPNGKQLANFSYAIDKEHSTLKLSLSYFAHAVLAYRGTITTDPKTGAVWRITNSADDIPSEVRTKSISTQIDYAMTVIGGAKYLLPAHASVSSITNSNNLRNDMRFENYRKFTANSTLITSPETTDHH